MARRQADGLAHCSAVGLAPAVGLARSLGWPVARRQADGLAHYSAVGLSPDWSLRLGDGRPSRLWLPLLSPWSVLSQLGTLPLARSALSRLGPHSPSRRARSRVDPPQVRGRDLGWISLVDLPIRWDLGGTSGGRHGAPPLLVGPGTRARTRSRGPPPRRTRPRAGRGPGQSRARSGRSRAGPVGPAG